jgi:hypothetical protein
MRDSQSRGVTGAVVFDVSQGQAPALSRQRPALCGEQMTNIAIILRWVYRAAAFPSPIRKARVTGLKLPSDLHGLTLASFAQGQPNELPARLGPACNQIRKLVKDLGVRTLTT